MLLLCQPPHQLDHFSPCQIGARLQLGSCHHLQKRVRLGYSTRGCVCKYLPSICNDLQLLLPGSNCSFMVCRRLQASPSGRCLLLLRICQILCRHLQISLSCCFALLCSSLACFLLCLVLSVGGRLILQGLLEQSKIVICVDFCLSQ